MKKLELLDLDATPTLLYPVPSTLQPTQWLLSSRSCALLFDVRPAPFALLSRARPVTHRPLSVLAYHPVRLLTVSCDFPYCTRMWSFFSGNTYISYLLAETVWWPQRSTPSPASSLGSWSSPTWATWPTPRARILPTWRIKVTKKWNI